MRKAKDMNVLVIDEHVLCRDLIRTVLKNIGFSVFSVDCGNDAIKFMNNRRVDVVLCDHRMPDMTGLELLKRVRQGSKNPNVPFMMLTGESAPELIREALINGADDYITKPFSTVTLGEKIVRALERRSQAATS